MTDGIMDIFDFLKEHAEYLEDGIVSRDHVAKAGLTLNPNFLSLLLDNKRTRKLFFVEVNGIPIFDKIEFQRFVKSKEFLPNNYTKFQQNIGLTVENNFLSDLNGVTLQWPYKDCVLEGGQMNDKESRNEPFWNKYLNTEEISTLLTRKVLHENHIFSNEDKAMNDLLELEKFNQIIKGNNLLALHSLKRRYENKVDVIYIDPPYYFKEKKGSDTFSYNSNFKLSSWLGFMRDRLEVSRKLLSDDGVIFISTNEDGLYHLKIIAEEIFSEEYPYVANFIWQKRAGGGNDSEAISTNHEFILTFGSANAFQKLPFDETQLKKYNLKDEKIDTHGPYTTKNLHDSSLQDSKGLHFDIECPDGSILRGDEHQWKCNEDTFNERLNDNRIVFKRIQKNNSWSVHYKIYLWENKGKLIYDKNGKLVKKGIVPNSFLDPKKVGRNGDATKELKKLFDGKPVFSYPKPTKLIVHLLQMIENKNALVLDYFAGSGTTGHAVLELNQQDGGNRNFILVEQMKYCKSLTRERIVRCMSQNDYKSSFIYSEMFERGATYISKIQIAQSRKDLMDILDEIKSTNLVSHVINYEEVAEQIHSLNVVEIKDFLLEILNQNVAYLSALDIEDKTFSIDSNVKSFNKKYYGE